MRCARLHRSERCSLLTSFSALLIVGLGCPLPAATQIAPAGVVTHHNDNARTGVNENERILTPTNVNLDTGQFHLLYKLPVHGQVYAQPLFVPNVRQADGRVLNLLVIATEMN